MFLLILIVFVSNNNIFSQVDTESMRKIDMNLGTFHNLQTNFGLRKGNTEFISVALNYRVDFVKEEEHYYGIGNISYQDNQGRVFQRSGFIHFRYLRKWGEYFHKEAYIQKQFDSFQRLKDRNLLGGGVRFSFDVKDSTKRIFYIFMGTGIMYENELLNISKNYSTNLIRSSSYLNLSWIPSENFNISTVTYYQVDIFNNDDYRILNISSLNFKFNKFLTFVVQFNYRYDSDPPQSDIKEFDYEIRNGLKFEF